MKRIDPHTESDPVAILAQFLVAFGNVIGRSAYFQIEGDRHYTNLFATIVGTSSKARKGTSWGQVSSRFMGIDAQWTERNILSGLSSGEGLIWAVRNEILKHDPVRKGGRVIDYQDVVADPGIKDKRLLVLESEFASTLRVLGRDGNNLSAIVRCAWDSGNLRTMTKNSPAVATGAHVSIIGHVTKNELLRYLDSTEAGNGFANRYLWLCAKRSKLLPDGGRLDEEDLRDLQDGLVTATREARKIGRMTRDEESSEIWRAVYGELSAGHAGLFGAVVSRAEAQVIRLSCIYALLDQSPVIRKEHLLAALAVWEYAEASARFIFGDALGDPMADEILRALRNSPSGLTRTEIRDLFGRNRKSHQIDRALGVLVESNLAASGREETDGRPAECWFANVSRGDRELPR